MPRRPRVSTAGLFFHVVNRAAKRSTLFETAEDYTAFEGVLGSAVDRHRVSLFAYCVMPNHWHLLLSARRWSALALHALAHDHPRQTMADTSWARGTGSSLPRAVQGDPDWRRSPLPVGVSVCRTESTACGSRQPSRRLAVVKPFDAPKAPIVVLGSMAGQLPCRLACTCRPAPD